MQILLISVLVKFGHSAQYEVTEEACANDLLFISSAEECEAAANALGITWNSCCQNNNNLPYGCLKRSDNDVIWNGNANTPNQFPCTVAGNCDHGMRWAVCRSVWYEVTEDACADDLFISSAEDCEAAANALDIQWNSCCQNNDNLPYGCLKRSDNDVIWNGNANTPNQFPCTVAGNCDHGMRWAVCDKGVDDSTFESEAHKTCCLDGWDQGTDCQHGCWNCACSDGTAQCGCINLDNVDEADYYPPTGLGDAESAHWIAAGNPSNSLWSGIPTQECVADSSVQAPQGTSYGADIAVSCCSESGSGVRKFDGDCFQAVTFEEAESMCNDNGYRLCTLTEMMDKVTKGAGCSHDARYNWVSDECDVGTDAAVFGFEYEPEQLPWTVTLSGKDLLILLLVAINMVSIVAVCCVCARTKGSRNGTTKYKVVRMVGDSEMDSEEIALQR